VVNKIDIPETEQFISKDYDPSKEYYQSIIIKLDNDEQYMFIGKAFTLDKEDVTIVNIKIGEPTPVPDGIRLGVMD